jgi:hypothetical protein
MRDRKGPVCGGCNGRGWKVVQYLDGVLGEYFSIARRACTDCGGVGWSAAEWPEASWPGSGMSPYRLAPRASRWPHVAFNDHSLRDKGLASAKAAESVVQQAV